MPRPVNRWRQPSAVVIRFCPPVLETGVPPNLGTAGYRGAPLDRCLQPPSGSNGLSAHQARARDVLSPTRFHSDHRSFGRSGRDGDAHKRQVPSSFSQVLAFDIRRIQLQLRWCRAGALRSEAMSSSTEVLRHARLFAAGLLLVVHAPFSPFRGTVTLEANGAPLKDGEGRRVRRRTGPVT